MISKLIGKPTHSRFRSAHPDLALSDLVFCVNMGCILKGALERSSTNSREINPCTSNKFYILLSHVYYPFMWSFWYDLLKLNGQPLLHSALTACVLTIKEPSHLARKIQTIL